MPNCRRSPRIGWAYSATSPRRSLSASCSATVAVVGVDRHLGVHARRREVVVPRHRRPLEEGGFEDRLDHGPGGETRLHRVVALEIRTADGSAQARPLARTERRHLDPALLGLVQPVAGGDAGLGAVEAGSDRSRLPVHQEDVGTEDGRTVEERGPEILPLAGPALVVQGGQEAHDGDHGVGRIGHRRSGGTGADCPRPRDQPRTRGRRPPDTRGSSPPKSDSGPSAPYAYVLQCTS